MEFYGLVKSTLIDYPNRVASVIFTKGCNLSCPFCHNKELVDSRYNVESISWNAIVEHLNKRKKVLSGVVISGGEPLLYANELQDIIDEIHSIGLNVKLDTNGILFDRLIEIKNVDFYAMDIKSSIDKYNLVCPHFDAKIKQNVLSSIDFIINSGVDYEFRTTVVPNIVDMQDIKYICSEMIAGAKKYSLAQFRPSNTLNPDFENVVPYGDTFFTQAKQIVEDAGISCELRVGY